MDWCQTKARKHPTLTSGLPRGMERARGGTGCWPAAFTKGYPSVPVRAERRVDASGRCTACASWITGVIVRMLRHSRAFAAAASHCTCTHGNSLPSSEENSRQSVGSERRLVSLHLRKANWIYYCSCWNGGKVRLPFRPGLRQCVAPGGAPRGLGRLHLVLPPSGPGAG